MVAINDSASKYILHFNEKPNGFFNADSQVLKIHAYNLIHL